MKLLGLSANALAQRLGVTTVRVNEIANKRRGITGDTAVETLLFHHARILDESPAAV